MGRSKTIKAQPDFRPAEQVDGEVWAEIEADKLGWFLMALEIEHPEQSGLWLRIKVSAAQLADLAQAIKAAQKETADNTSERP